MHVTTYQPENYHLGAYRVKITLAPDERQLVKRFRTLPFPLPKLPKRLLLADDGFRAVGRRNGQPEVMGKLKAIRGWEGHLYTNGIDEANNPTPIETVLKELELLVVNTLQAMRDWS